MDKVNKIEVAEFVVKKFLEFLGNEKNTIIGKRPKPEENADDELVNPEADDDGDGPSLSNLDAASSITNESNRRNRRNNSKMLSNMPQSPKTTQEQEQDVLLWFIKYGPVCDFSLVSDGMVKKYFKNTGLRVEPETLEVARSLYQTHCTREMMTLNQKPKTIKRNITKSE